MSDHATGEELALADIEQRCLQAVLAGGHTWDRFKADAEHETGLPWPQIKYLLDERAREQARDSIEA